MKKVLLMILLCVTLSIDIVADDYVMPQKVVMVTKSNVNVRQTPDLNSAVKYKASLGTLFEFVSKSGSWYEVKEAFTGNTVYISTSVAKMLGGENVPSTQSCVSYGPTEAGNYKLKEVTAKCEVTTSLNFYLNDKKEDGYLYLAWTWMYADTNGRSNTQERLYRGYQKGWYMVFDSTVDYDGNVTMLDSPVIYYATDPYGSKVTSQGVVYEMESEFTW